MNIEDNVNEISKQSSENNKLVKMDQEQIFVLYPLAESYPVALCVAG